MLLILLLGLSASLGTSAGVFENANGCAVQVVYVTQFIKAPGSIFKSSVRHRKKSVSVPQRAALGRSRPELPEKMSFGFENEFVAE